MNIVLLLADGKEMKAALDGRMPNSRAFSSLADLPVDAGREGALFFVDWLLPAESGLAMCRRLREREDMSRAYIVMVLDNDSADDRRRAMLAGADDYVVGPVTAEGLIDKAEQIVNSARHAGSELATVCPGLVIDYAARIVRWHGRPVMLTNCEFDVLNALVQRKGRVVSRNELITMIRSAESKVDEMTPVVWIKRLRRALSEQGAPDVVRTIKTKGYAIFSG